jgi:hypothetical protein
MGAIEMSALGVAMRQSLWLYPIVEIVHLTGIALLVGSIAMLDLRLLGLSNSVPVRRLASHPAGPPRASCSCRAGSPCSSRMPAISSPARCSCEDRLILPRE